MGIDELLMFDCLVQNNLLVFNITDKLAYRFIAKFALFSEPYIILSGLKYTTTTTTTNVSLW